MNFLYFLGFEAVGLVLIKYAVWIVNHTFRSAFFENFLGTGGTYTAAKLLGVATMAFGFWWLFH